MAMVKLENKKIAIIGSGHIASALIEGLISSGEIFASNLMISNPLGFGLEDLKKRYKVKTTKDNREAVLASNYIFIAVRPFTVKEVMDEIKKEVKGKIIISIVAGVDLKSLADFTNEDQKIIRIMPNIPMSCNQGVIGLFANKNVPVSEKEEVMKLLSLLGLAIELEKEEDLNVLTLVSACGPAIVSQFIELLSIYGEDLKLSKEISEKVSMQTFKGALSYLEKTKLSPSVLKESVATKGGVTEAILLAMKKNKFEKAFKKSMTAGYKKIKETKRKLRVKE